MRRSSGGDTRFLAWKVRLFAIGATLGLAGIWLDIQALIWGALAVLLAGFFVRFLSFGPRLDADDSRDEVHDGPDEVHDTQDAVDDTQDAPPEQDGP